MRRRVRLVDTLNAVQLKKICHEDFLLYAAKKAAAVGRSKIVIGCSYFVGGVPVPPVPAVGGHGLPAGDIPDPRELFCVLPEVEGDEFWLAD